MHSYKCNEAGLANSSPPQAEVGVVGPAYSVDGAWIFIELRLKVPYTDPRTITLYPNMSGIQLDRWAWDSGLAFFVLS